jgi:1-acyl-sn-glycerol-3-phosphate acyltransferase
MRRIRRGGQVVVFAEGTRTIDGCIGPFLPGVAVLAQRAARWTVPVLIDGAFEAWPRTQAIPYPGSIVVEYAPPIPQEKARELSSQELVDQVRRTLIEMQAGLRHRLGKRKLDYD